MARADALIQQIRQCLAKGEQAPLSEVERLAEAYRERVEAINHRLERCVELLREGLAGEAVHQAELAPPVLEEAAALDLPEFDDWHALCLQNEVAPPPGVNTHAVEELDEAYPRHQAIEPLLAAHRRLALGRAPLPQRIRVLRRLSQADPENPAWGEDLSAFEQARHKQIAQEAERAHQAGDLDQLRQLEQELNQRWLEAPPEKLKQRVTASRRKVEADEARRQLPQIERMAQAAYEDGDVDRLAELLDTYQNEARKVDRSGESSESEAIAQARAWLEDQQAQRRQHEQFQALVGELETALDQERSNQVLDRLWARLEEYDEPIPDMLKRRYHGLKHERAVEASRKFRLKLAGVVGALLVVGATIGFGVYYTMARRAVAEWREQINSAIDNKSYSDAEALLQTLKRDRPGLYERATFQGLAKKVDRLIEEDKQRHQRFEAALSKAEAVTPPDPDHPALDRAGELARTEKEKARLDTLRAELQQKALAKEKAANKKFSDRLSALRERFATLKDQDGISQQRIENLKTLSDKLNELLNTDGVSDSLKQPARALQQSANELATTLAEKRTRQREQHEAIEQIRGLYGQPEALAKALRSFAEDYPQHPFASDFRVAAEAEDAWTALADWRENVASTFKPFEPTATKQINRRLGAIEHYRENHDIKLLGETPDRYTKYLERARAGVTQRAGEDLRDLLDNPLVSNLKVITTVNGRRYYTHADDPIQDMGRGQYTIDYAKTIPEALGRENLSEITLTAGELASPEATPAPQRGFASQFSQWLKSDNHTWAYQHARALNALLERDDIELPLKAQLAERLAKMSHQHDWRPQPELRAWARRLEDLDYDTDWLDPVPQAEEAQKPLRELMNDAPTLPDRQAFKQWANRLAEELAGREPIGLVWQNDGSASLHVGNAPSGSGRLEVVTRADGQWQLTPAGQWREDEGTLSDASDLPIGTIVYWQPGQDQQTGDVLSADE